MTKDENKLPSYPPPYKVRDGCLHCEVRNRNGSTDQKLCNFLPYIVSELTIDDGAEVNRRLRLGGFRCSGSPLPEIEITGSELGSFNWLIDKWGADSVLEIGQSVRDSVRYAIQMTAADAQRQTIYAVTGWKKVGGVWHFLMPGDDEQTVQLPDKLSHYRRAETIDTAAFRVAAALLDQPPAPKEVIWPLLAFTFLTPLNHFLRAANCEPKFVLLLSGRTGTRKSTLAALFLSIFGSFTASEMPMSFRDTANSITYNAFTLKDVLTCIDDFHPCGRQEEQKLSATAQAIMRAYGDRTGRGRLRADATPMASRPPQGNAIITAEFAPDIGESGTARLFTTELRPGDVELELLSAYQAEAARGALRSCMLAYTEWICRKFLCDEEAETSFLSLLRRWFEDWRDDFRKGGILCHGRLPEIVAWFQIGMKMFLWFLLDQHIVEEKQMEDSMAAFSSLLYALARKQARSIEQDKPAVIFVRKLFALLENGQVRTIPRDAPAHMFSKDVVGFEDDCFYYLLNDAAHRAVKKLCEDQDELFSISSRSLPKALADEGLVECVGGENTRSIRFHGGTKRVVCLHKEKAKLLAEGALA